MVGAVRNALSLIPQRLSYIMLATTLCENVRAYCGRNIKTMEGYLLINFEVVSSNSFRDIPKQAADFVNNERTNEN